MPYLSTKDLIEIRIYLEQARQASTLETANFFPFERDSDEKMNVLRQRVGLHHKSWITTPIDNVLQKLSDITTKKQER